MKLIPQYIQRLTMKPFLILCQLIRVTILTGLPLVLLANSAVALTTPNYVQGNSAVPPTPQTTVTVTYTATQTAGNLNVVIVGWSNSTSQLTSLTDSKGNLYQLAVGPTVLTGSAPCSQAIYYAKKISAATAGTNAVTVKFNAAAAYPDIRILEYSGIDPTTPLDVSAGATGNSATSSSAVVTKNASDLLVAANCVWTSTVGPGSGLIQRILTSPDGDIAEDRVVTAIGSYNASAPLSSAGAWVMQMVAFRAAASPTPTPTPKPTPTPTPTPAALTYVQGSYKTPQSALTSVQVPYAAAQTAGNTNVVIVGWSDATAHINSVSDSNANLYQVAVGPTVLTGSAPLSQAIYYAKNVKAGGNTVTVTFNAAAIYADIRILEYRGIDPLSPVDVVASATGNSATSSSSAVTTKNARDLLVGANTVWTTTTSPGSSYTQRLLTDPDGDIAEDRVVTATGSYNANAPLSSAGAWVMQMVAFRGANSGSSSSTPPPSTPTPSPTPKPSPTPTPTPTPKPSPTPGSSVTLSWNVNLPTSNPVTNTAGYRLHSGLANGVYTQSTTLGNTTTVTVSKLSSGTTYYFAISAYNSSGIDSPPSNQVSYKAP